MQKIFRRLRLRRRPVVFLAVFVGPHHEELDRLVCGELVPDPFTEKIVPIENNARITVFGGMGTEVNVSDAATESGVTADLDQQMLLRACRLSGSVGFGTHIVSS